ncbi:DNA topoisomerase 3 [Carnimonas sp. R-84981]|uniref:DNA topoisomerase III n=1 Tax=Carnimonas bestiolae TaxID=3402172 RepID=UPI003EDC0940
MRLIIAEKPSLARAIAAAHDQHFTQREGYLEASDTLISWCYGHLLEQAPPDYYHPAYKKWALEHLPIVPTQWQLVPRPKSRAQLGVLKRLLKRANEVVHAGDPDREGQLLVQETLEYLGWQGSTHRLLINDMNRSAVRKALASMRDNREFLALYSAAESRARADWLYGINLTRAWTLTGQKAGYQGVLSVGRVQTPVLGLVARRDAEIEAFVPALFYALWADFTTAQGTTRAWWQPRNSESLKASGQMDDAGRLLDRRLADQLFASLPNAAARVLQVKRQHKRQRPPLPYSLSTLQIDAARRYKLSAKAVLDAAQSLYERHKISTYPRSDCRYLPSSYLQQIGTTLDNACANDHTLSGWRQGCDDSRRSAAFNDAEIGAHHAIAPTGRQPDWSRLGQTEAQVYRLIVRNVLAQFYPHHEFHDVTATFEAPTNSDAMPPEAFVARGKEITVAGWKPLFASREQAPPLPTLNEGETAQVADCAVEDRLTQAPAHFNDASLLNAMTHVARYVKDPAIRDTLRETDGLGTEATRAGIIETLIKRGLMARVSGSLRATQAGRALIAALPEDATTPERTAHWEQALSLIGEEKANATSFEQQLKEEITRLLAATDIQRMRHALSLKQGVEANAAPKSGARRQRSGSTSKRRSAGTSKRRSRSD